MKPRFLKKCYKKYWTSLNLHIFSVLNQSEPNHKSISFQGAVIWLSKGYFSTAFNETILVSWIKLQCIILYTGILMETLYYCA